MSAISDETVGARSINLDEKDIADIENAFDRNFYLEKYDDVRAAGFDPLGHYMMSGWSEMRDPSPSFSTSDYLEQNPDVLSSTQNPFIHWVLIGRHEGRPGKKIKSDFTEYQKQDEESFGLTPEHYLILQQNFDLEYYLSNNPDIAASEINALSHYLATGWVEGRNPSRDFNTSYYVSAHREYIESGQNPFLYWLTTGKSAGHAGKPNTDEHPAVKFEEFGELIYPADLQKLKDAFDNNFYLANNKDVEAAGIDPFDHYMTNGWREGRDPSDSFSTSYYLEAYKDIQKANINPFVHYILHGTNEGRRPLSFRKLIAKLETKLKVSAIVPNYNHAKFLGARLESIINQTYPVSEIIVLDDCSTDDSASVIEFYAKRYPGKIKFVPNEKNSGGVFNQWKKGFELAANEIIWICESDDFCEPDFVENLVHYFKDYSVNIAFGRILETDVKGNPDFYLDEWRNNAEPGVWGTPLIRPAALWFSNALGTANVIANVGGCLMRRMPLSESIWAEATSYRVVGDWFLYLNVAQGGQIAWDPKAVSYFRRHGSNTSSVSFAQPYFYKEVEQFMLKLRETWDVPAATVNRFWQSMAGQYKWFDNFDKIGPFNELCNYAKLHGRHRHRPHILISFYGFIPGGGESFPIMLANALHERGYMISMLGFEFREINEHMRNSLNPSIAVYDSAWVDEYGADNFIRDAGVQLIHSHTIGSEYNFFEHWKISAKVSYLVTLHGSYEASELDDGRLERLASRVDHFVYTADKNLLPLRPAQVSPQRLTKFANAMPIDPRPFPKSRSELDIADDAVVFAFVARGIKSKGWQQVIEAFVSIYDTGEYKPMHLLLVGGGEEPDRLSEIYIDNKNISFLGYQACIHGLYRMSDVAVVPSRFSGESYPLCIIQALQMGLPVIGTRVGEIASMIAADDAVEAGILIEPIADDNFFVQSLRTAMIEMLDAHRRSVYAQNAAKLGENYDMTKLAAQYSELYGNLIIEKFYCNQ